MESEIVERVSEWETRPFSGGYAGLHDLADAEFTGAVCQGSAWAFMLNGRVVGVFDGTIDDFEDTDGTAYVAPDPALPLLYTMQERGGELRAQYYTNDTSISEVDTTLSSGNFTGYVELSENVLSGDYYIVYYGGKSMSVAFLGNKRDLLAGDEAFDHANDEVGIYGVHAVDIEIVDVPEPAHEPEPEPTSTPAATSGVVSDEDGSAGEDELADQDESSDEGELTDESATSSDDATVSDRSQSPPSDTSEAPADDRSTSSVAFGSDERDTTTEVGADPAAAEAAAAEATADDVVDERVDATSTDRPSESGVTESSDESTPSGTPDESAPATTADEPTADESFAVGDDTGDTGDTGGTDESDDRAHAESTERERAASTAAQGAGVAGAGADRFSDEERWRNATSIPALDPSDSETERGEHPGRAADVRRPSVTQRQPNGPAQRRESNTSADQEPTADQSAAVDELSAELDQAEQALTKSEARREELTAERNRYREEVERLEGRIEELEAEITRLRTDLETARERGPDVAASGETMSPDEALDGTNLFVRYGTKSGGTLEKAHAGESTQEEVNDNLRLEHHTRFDTEDLTVDDRPFDEFLRRTVEYGFVEWVVEDLLYEIGETGKQGDLADLFDAIPNVDRAELHGTVSIQYQEGGEEHREQETFDVVLRDRMGNPLVVANFNDSRDAATESMMVELIENANHVAESSETLGAAFAVTTSYFEPEALETATDATGGGLFGRGKRASYVKLSRKRGYHLCLVETRNGEYHLNVPEL